MLADASLQLSARHVALQKALGCLNAADFDGFAELFDPSVITVDPAVGNPVGRTWISDEQRALRKRFPDLSYQFDELIEAGELSLLLVTVMGTDPSGLLGTRSPGHAYRLPVCLVLEWAGEQVVTIRGYSEPGLVPRLLRPSDGFGAPVDVPPSATFEGVES